MKNAAVLVLGILFSISTFASNDFAKQFKDVPLVKMPAFNLKAIQLEDQMDKLGNEAPRFAYTHNVNIQPSKSGSWEVKGDLSIWRLRIESTQAESINLGFTTYELPQGASLKVYSNDGKMVRGPYTAGNNNPAQELWTPVVFGDLIIVELRVPTVNRSEVKLVLSHVNHDYLGFGKAKMRSQKSGSCNIDVVCPEGDTHAEQVRSVATISFSGNRFCSGAMINNTANDGKPYFLTAHHCRVRADNAASLVAYWNFQNSTCRPANSSASGGRGDGDLSQTSTGASLKASTVASDFTLVEFFSAPNQEYRVYYSGWDRRDLAPTSSAAIHHPNVDEKRISFDSDPGTISSYLDRGNERTHIKVTDWDLGTTEPGSSGSPLFNQDKRIVGQLHGGYASCRNDLADWYGRITYSWDNGNDTNSLKAWLDPTNSGLEFIDGIEQP